MEDIKEIELLIDISKNKYTLAEEMLTLTEKIVESISDQSKDEHSQDIVNLIALREDLIKNIDKLDEEFINVFDSIKKLLKIENISQIDVTKYPDIVILKNIIHNIYGVLVRIEKANIILKNKIENKLNETKVELKNLNNSGKVNNAYKKSSGDIYMHSSIIDKTR